MSTTSRIPRLTVIGSLNMDLVIHADAVPRPGESLLGHSFDTGLGGKGSNQAVACYRLGDDVALAGKVGNDLFGDRIVSELANEGLDLTNVQRSSDAATGVAFIIIEPSGQNRIIAVPGANLTFTADDVSAMASCISDSKMLLLQLEIDFAATKRAAAGSCTSTTSRPRWPSRTSS